MALILNIDTATPAASICLSDNGRPLRVKHNDNQMDHAAWLHVAIDELMTQGGRELSHLDAVAVTSGPGSYTGLRVAMSTAKGFCYALGIPLIAENTLTLMAFAAREQGADSGCLLGPMIDARRMEVFTALYTQELEPLISPGAMVLDEQSFSAYLASRDILFFGNGTQKWAGVSKSPRVHIIEISMHAGYLGILSYEKWNKRDFTDIVYSEPAYTKDFYTHTGK